MTNQHETPASPLGRRFRCALPVTLRRRSQDLELITSDVSFKGAFVRCGEPPPANSLIRLAFTLPPDDAKVTVSGTVVQVVRAAEANAVEYPGFAVQFLPLDGPVKQRWEQFVVPLSREAGAEKKKTRFFARPSYVGRIALPSSPAAVSLERHLSFDELVKVVDEAVATGTLFVPTETAVAPGANVDVRLIHPMTEESFPLTGTARRPDAHATAGGVDVRLHALDEDTRATLEAFRDSVILVDDYDVDVLEASRVSLPPTRAPEPRRSG